MTLRVIQTVFLTTLVCLTLSAQPWMRAPYLSVSKNEAGFNEIRDAFHAYWGSKPYEKGKGFKQFKRWEYMAERAGFPDGNIPSAASYFEHYKVAVEAGSGYKSTEATASWIPLGISTWQNGNSGYNPGNGRVNYIAQHPTDPDIIYIASASGGIWKSTDGGQSWNTTFDDLTRLGTSCIAIHPNNPSQLFVGTGDKDGWNTEAFGILSSSDAGNTWNPGGLNTGLTYNNINKILINPQNPQSMLVATPNHIYKSTDGGNSWDDVYTGNDIRDMEYKPGDTSIIYTGGERYLRSNNGGLSFAYVSGLPTDTSRLEVAVSPSNPAYVYVLASNSSSSFGGLYRSTDSGLTFSLMSSSPNLLGYAEDGSDDAGQAWYDLALAVSPIDANDVFIGGINVWRSTDGGSNWTICTHWVYGGSYGYSHADIHYLGFYGTNLYCGSDGGAFVSHDFGNTWNDLSAGLEITQYYAFSNSSLNNNLIVAGAQDNGSNLFLNGTWTHVFGADGFEALTHPTDELTFYASYQNGGILRTRDGGQNFDYINTTGQEGAWLTPLAMDPADPDLIYMALEDLFLSPDAGDSWINLTNGITNFSTIDELEITSGGNDLYFSDYNKFYYSHDGGTTWEMKVPGAAYFISGIEVSPNDPMTLWITQTGSGGDRVYVSNNGGDTWTNLTGAISGTGINCIMHDPATIDGIYVGTNTGVFYRDSSMTAWVNFDEGLPKVIVNELEISASGKLRAATYGRGIWESHLYHPTGIPGQESSFEIFPNPAADFVNIHTIEGIKPQQVVIFDAAGKMLEAVPVNSDPQTIDLSSYPTGSYYLRIESNNTTLDVKKLSILKNE